MGRLGNLCILVFHFLLLVAVNRTSIVRAQNLIFNSAGYRSSLFYNAADSVVVSDFSEYGTGEILTHEKTIQYYDYFLFSVISQDSLGATRSQFLGPRFLQGTSTAQVPTQTPAAVSKLTPIKLSGDSKIDLAAITSSGKVLIFKNKGHTLYQNGFSDMNSNSDSFEIFDFSDPSVPENTLSLRPFYTVLQNGDFNGDGCEDLATGGVGITGPNVSDETSLGIYIFWCTPNGGFSTSPTSVSLGASYPIDTEWHEPSQTLYVLGKEPTPFAWAIANTTVTALKFGQTQLNSQTQISFPGLPNSLALGDWNQDNTLDFLISGNTTPTSLTQSQGLLWLYGGTRFSGADQPNVALANSINLPINANQFDLVSVKSTDLNNDGIVDFAAVATFGNDTQNSSLFRASELVYGFGPLNSSPIIYQKTLSGFNSLASLNWADNYPQYQTVTDILSFWDINRDSYPDIVVGGVTDIQWINNIPQMISKGTETLLNQPQGVPENYIQDYGNYDTKPYTLGLSGGEPVVGADLKIVVKDLSLGQIISMNYDTTPSSFMFSTPSLFAGSKNIWIGVLPQFSSFSYFMPSSGLGTLGTSDSHAFELSFKIPNNPALFGFEGYMQAIILDTTTGFYSSTQGIALKVGN